MGKSKNTTIGYRYYMGLHAGLCHGPVDALVDIRGGNLSFGITTPVTASSEIYINQPNLYGGDKKEGGVQGYLDVMMGEITQGVNSYLASVQGGIQNAYRGLMTCVFRAGLIGSNNPYPKPWSFRVQRATMGWDGGTPWYPAKAAIPLGNFEASSINWLYYVTSNSDSTDYSSPTFDASSWAIGRFPFGNAPWTPTWDAPADHGFSNIPATVIPITHTVWMRTTLSLGAVPDAMNLQAFVDNECEIYFNGTLAASIPYSDVTLYTEMSVPSTGLTVGDNVIAVKLVDPGSGTGDFIWLDWRLTGFNAVIAMNPAHIVYETLTNRDWGMGYPSSIIDTTAFQASADQHFAEGLGLCLAWDREDTVQNFIQSIMDYAGAVLVQSKTTGLFQYNLIRGGYDATTLPIFTRDNIIGLESLESPSITGATNEVVVRWFDPVSKTKQYTTVQALGAIQAQGCIVSVTKDYPGIASSDLAGRIAARELQAVSTPLKKLKVKFDRTAYALLPGGLFVLNFPDLGIESVAFRVGEVDYGTIDQGVITVTAVQDVFDLPLSTYIAPTIAGNSSSWAAPDKAAYPATIYYGFEASYRDLYIELSSSALGTLEASAGYASMVVAKPTSLSINYQIYTRTGSAAFVEQGSENFCPYGTLSAAIGPFDVSITIQNGIDLNGVSVPCAAYIDNEIVQVTALNPSTGVATIARGCVDTVAVSHAANAPVWIFDNYTGTDEVEYFSGETVNMQPITVTSTSTLAESSAPTINVSITGRASLPYPPAAPKINGTRFDSISSVSGSFTVAWAERNRITQQDQLIDTTQATITPEINTRYFLGFYNASGTLLISQNNIGVPSATVTLNYTGNVTMKLYSTNDNGNSQQEWVITFAYTPPSGSPTDTITATAYTPVYNGTIVDGGHA